MRSPGKSVRSEQTGVTRPTSQGCHQRSEVIMELKSEHEPEAALTTYGTTRSDWPRCCMVKLRRAGTSARSGGLNASSKSLGQATGRMLKTG